MITINKSSLHYRFLRNDCSGAIPENLCPYMRSLLFHSVTKFVFILAVLFMVFTAFFSLLNPAITLLGFYIGNGWSFPDYLPHVTYMDSFGDLFGSYLLALWGAGPVEIKKLAVLYFEHDYSITGLFMWMTYVCPGSIFTWGIVALTLALFFLLFIVVNCVDRYKEAGVTKRLHQKAEAHPDNFLVLCYEYYKAKHDKFCPGLNFVDTDKNNP